MPYIYPVIKNNMTKYTVYYLYKTKKIYIGIYTHESDAIQAYAYCDSILHSTLTLEQCDCAFISFQKLVTLLNFRDHNVLINHPIYLYDGYFKYFLSEKNHLLFDLRDLFFFSTYKIHKRGNYLYTMNRHSQSSILSRLGIPPKSTYGTDYIFANGNRYDFRRSNIIILNHYHGVTCKTKEGGTIYTTRIYHNKNIVVGHYTSEVTAAIAYNKAIDVLTTHGTSREYTPNTIPYLTKSEYQHIYATITLSSRLTSSSIQKKVVSHKRYRGTYKDKSGFKSCIGYQNKQIHLGNYPTELRAAQAYNFASMYLYGREGYINQVTPLIYDKDELTIYHKLEKAGVLKQPYLFQDPSTI